MVIPTSTTFHAMVRRCRRRPVRTSSLTGSVYRHRCVVVTSSVIVDTTSAIGDGRIEAVADGADSVLERSELVRREGTGQVALESIEVNRERGKQRVASLGGEDDTYDTTVSGVGASSDETCRLESVDESSGAAGRQCDASCEFSYRERLARGSGEADQDLEGL
jgi:hypothetical protein